MNFANLKVTREQRENQPCGWFGLPVEMKFYSADYCLVSSFGLSTNDNGGICFLYPASGQL